jgi:hypothetical protein
MRQINSISLEISDLQGVYRTLREPTEKMHILNKIDNLDRERKRYLEDVRELRMDMHVILHADEPGGVSRDMRRCQTFVREAEENVKSVTKEIIDYQKMHGANPRSDFNFDQLTEQQREAQQELREAKEGVDNVLAYETEMNFDNLPAYVDRVARKIMERT